MINTGRAYEALTEQVFLRLLAQSNVCVKVERDVVLAGKSTSHQIDVTFEFVMGTTSYRTIVQCKDWASAVKQEQVLAFHDVLGDIPGQPRGIMVSRSGFQEGARNVAAHHGIQLYELRAPRDEDWAGLIRTIEIQLALLTPVFSNVRFRFDDAWVKEQMDRLGLATMNVNLRIDPEVETLLFESGQECDLKEVLRPYVPEEPCEKVPLHHELEVALMIDLPDAPISRLRATAVDAEVSVHKEERLIRVNIDHLIAYCFRDVVSGKAQFLGKDGSPVVKR